MMPGEICWVDYPFSSSREQHGLRPAIILQDDTAFSYLPPLVVTVALTSKLTALRFPATLRIDPNPTNGLTVPSVALIYQVRAVDRNRIQGAIGRLEQTVLDDVYSLLDRLMGR
jgi:mRNA interferase MazF